MKLYHVAAATLLLGTSALAWTPDAAPVANGDKTLVTTSAHDGKPADLALASETDDFEAAWTDSAAWSDGEPKPINAAAVTWQEPEPAAEADPDLDLAEPPVEAAPLDTPTETVAAPVEIASADLTPRPAAGNYPPCDPGPGDDNCIQLYEPGVRVALASWNRPTGGLADGSAATAMGGPYEPIDGASGETAMNGDGLVDAEAGETAQAETTGL